MYSILSKYKLVILVFLGSSIQLWGQLLSYNVDSYHSVYLIGNGADLLDQSDLRDRLEKEFSSHENLFTLLIAGDAFDLSRSLETQYNQLENLYAIIELVGGHVNGKCVVITGDRDWSGRTANGEMALLELEERVQKFVNREKINNFQWVVNNGCPGPHRIVLDEHIDLLCVNSNWWNEPTNKPHAADGLCTNIRSGEIEEALIGHIEENIEKNIIVLAHHPIISIGRYGGRFSFLDHFKPFPFLGLLRVAYASNIGSSNDLANKNMKAYTRMMEDVIFKHDNVVYVSGHEHNHQIVREDNNY